MSDNFMNNITVCGVCPAAAPSHVNNQQTTVRPSSGYHRENCSKSNDGTLTFYLVFLETASSSDVFRPPSPDSSLCHLLRSSLKGQWNSVKLKIFWICVHPGLRCFHLLFLRKFNPKREYVPFFYFFYFNGCVQVSWVQAMAQFQIILNLHKAPSVLKQSWPGIRSMYVINYSFGKCQRVRPSAEGSSPGWLIEPSAVGLFNNALNMYYSAAQSSRSHSISTHSFSNGHLGTPLPLLPFHS